MTGTYLYPYYGQREFHLEHGVKDKEDHCNSGRDYYMVHQAGALFSPVVRSTFLPAVKHADQWIIKCQAKVEEEVWLVTILENFTKIMWTMRRCVVNQTPW